MIKLYGTPLSHNVNKVRYALEYLNLAYEVVKLSPLEGDNKKPEYLDICPTGKIPAIDDGGFSLFESDAIIRYLAEKEKSTLYPQDIKKRAVVNAWMDFSSIHVGNALGRVTFNRVMAPMMKWEVDEKSLEFGLDMLSKYLPVIEKTLSKANYLAGLEVTVADISLLATFDPCELISYDLSPYKAVKAWRDNLKNQAFYKKPHNEHLALMRNMMGEKALV